MGRRKARTDRRQKTKGTERRTDRRTERKADRQRERQTGEKKGKDRGMMRSWRGPGEDGRGADMHKQTGDRGRETAAQI